MFDIGNIDTDPWKDLTEADLLAFAENDFDAIFTNAKVAEIEEKQQEWGIHRRTALLTLARSKKQLMEGFGNGESPDFAFEVIERLKEYEKHIFSLMEITGVAINRMLCIASVMQRGEMGVQP